jgi:lipid-binding SYLF domain-containing protein
VTPTHNDGFSGFTEEAEMKKHVKTKMGTLLLVAIVGMSSATIASAASRTELESDAAHALNNLYAQNTSAKLVGDHAVAVLVFPNIVKAGFMFGGQLGDGVLMRQGRPVGYYNSFAASYGLQAGLQVFGYALFFMNEKALEYLNKSSGWEIGVGPSIVVVDAGVGKNLSSTTLQKDIYAFIFDQKGLMAGLGIQGTKITKINK